jgi:hypothetical protein
LRGRGDGLLLADAYGQKYILKKKYLFLLFYFGKKYLFLLFYLFFFTFYCLRGRGWWVVASRCICSKMAKKFIYLFIYLFFTCHCSRDTVADGLGAMLDFDFDFKEFRC